MSFFRKTAPAPLLSDAEMARLNEEIFEEPVSVERLFAMFDAIPRDGRFRSVEWVMDQHMLNRIRKLAATESSFFESPPSNAPPLTLFGLPVVIEPFARLATRERVVNA